MDLQDPMIVEVLLDLPLPRGFDYHASLVTEEDVGRRVKVPWGTGQKVGVIRALKHTSTYPLDKIREVLEIWRDIPPLNARDWQLLEFCSAYYHYPLGQTVLAMLPPALRRSGAGFRRAGYANPGKILPRVRRCLSMRPNGRWCRRFSGNRTLPCT
jgi:Primosomal protein N'' (replication factor Y) - superfamily II helicase